MKNAMDVVRDQVAVVEMDSMADLVLSQGGTTTANLVCCQHKVGNLGRGYSSPLGAQRCSNLVRAQVLPPSAEDFDVVNAMTNLVVQAVRQMGLPSWLPLRELSSWSDHADRTAAIRGRLQGFLSRRRRRVILGVSHWGAVPNIEHAESARWLRALSVESRLSRWIACSDFGPLHDRFIEAKKPWPENSTFACWWQTVEDRVLLVRGGGRAGQAPPATSRATLTVSWCAGTSRRCTKAQYHSLAQVVVHRARYQLVRLLGGADTLRKKNMVHPVVICRCIARSSRNCCAEVHRQNVPVHHEAVKVAREVAGGGRPRDHLLHAQEYPVLNGLPPTGEGGILGPGLLCLDEPVVKRTKVGARNPTQQP